MRPRPIRILLVAALVAVGSLGPPASTSAAPGDPLFVLRPEPMPIPPQIPPPAGQFEGPCGLAVDGNADLYVADYHHHAIDVYSSAGTYSGQLAEEDPLDGPCGLALDAAGNLYVNNFHRNVVGFGDASSFGPGTVIAGAGVDESHPTGVAIDPVSGTVYVDERDHLTTFDGTGVEGEPIGAGSVEDGYGLAVSGYAATAGFLYIADAATESVEVYDPATGTTAPIAVIDGSGTPPGRFVSLRDGSLAVDGSSGTLYVVDDLTPEYTEGHEAVVYAFGPTGSYLGRLKFSIETALPAGLAVDNSGSATQGRVYVTSGYSENAAVYAYPPASAGEAAVPLSGLTPAAISAPVPAPARAAFSAVAVPDPQAGAAADIDAASAGAMQADDGSRAGHRHRGRAHLRARGRHRRRHALAAIGAPR
jgi:DNA-binding beta-propeller fold protein YncE